MYPPLIAAARWLRRRAENVAVGLLAVMFGTFILQIVFRYLLDAPLGWSEELIIATWLWTVLWGAAFTLSESEEIRFDILYSQIPERTRRIFTVITGLALVALYGISLPAAYGYVSFMKVEHSAYLRVPLNWMYSVFIIFMVACMGRYAWLTWRAIRGDKSPETDPAMLGD
ncbi:MAG TPA: TRAP transporter small permease subunit [Pseudolabrys sp.]|nr:TRAP transporter small permease subunit [Pseudolabrys sp.]